MKTTQLIAAIAGTFVAAQGFAIPITEIDDATDLLPGQSVVDGTTSISGSLSDTDLTDLFAFAWEGGALTINTLGTEFDPRLVLFDATGFGIAQNDDRRAPCSDIFPVCITLPQSEIAFSLAAGIYFVAITAADNDALDASARPIFEDFSFLIGGVIATEDLNNNPILRAPSPQNPLIDRGALAGWDETIIAGNSLSNYEIHFSAAVDNVDIVSVAEPGSLALLGIGVVGIGLAWRRRSISSANFRKRKTVGFFAS